MLFRIGLQFFAHKKGGGSTKNGRDSDLFLIEGIKNGNGGLKLLSPLVVHNEDNTYTDEVLEILKF